MTNKISIFTIEENGVKMDNNQVVGQSFEDFGMGDGTATWWASDFMDMLDYPNMPAFIKVIHRAMQACLSAGIDTSDDFTRENRVVNEVVVNDYKLTRFACYMVAMNGDIKKAQVANAQVYFAKATEQINIILEGATDVDRLILRQDIKVANKSLTAVAKASGVTDFAIFHDAGYKGMYNMGIKKLCQVKGVSKDLYDYMGKAELAANNFRLTMTEEKLKVRKVNNGYIANDVHKQVGADVRKMVRESTGKFPEQLPLERKLNDVSKGLKKASKQLNQSKSK